MQVNAGTVNQAFNELYKAKTIQVLQQLCKEEVLMLLALFLELRTTKSEKVLMEDVQDRINTIRNQAEQRSRQNHINTNLFRQIVKRMQAFGLISMEIMNTRITDNVFLQTSIY